MNRVIRFRLAALGAAAALALAACGGDDGAAETTDAPASSEQAGDTTTPDAGEAVDVSVVASTTWTGAYARMAGATDVTVIAPTSVLHPPDYDPKASDLVAAADADIVVYAEFESFATRLVEAAGSDTTAFPVTLENTTATIEAEVMRLAEELGTTEQARANLDEFLPAAAALGEDVAESVTDPAPVIVTELFMTYWADWAGLSSAGEFGPQPLTAGDLAGMLDLSPTLVFDNYHVPGGQALEAEGVPRIQLINYPGDDLDLLAVFQHNHDLIAQAMAGGITADPDVSVPEGGGTHGHGDTTHGDTTDTEAPHGHGDTTDTEAPHGHGESTDTEAPHGHGESTESTEG